MFLFLPLRLPIDIYIFYVDVVSVLWQSKQRADMVARVPIEIPVRI